MLKLNEDFYFEHLYARSRTGATDVSVDEFFNTCSITSGDILWLEYDSDIKELSISYVDDDEEIGEVLIRIHNQNELDRMNVHILSYYEKVVKDWTKFRNNGDVL